MRKLRQLVSSLALAALAAAAVPSQARAQTKADAFAGKIPPVSGQLYRKAGRFELSPSLDLSLNDAFFKKYFGGLKLAYHPLEQIAVALYASGGLVATSDSAVVCSASAGCRAANDGELDQVPGRIRGILGLEGAWSPVYGKLNVLAEKVAHFDLSILIGPDLIAYDEILSRAEADRLAATGGSPGLTTTVGAHVGLGARVFFAEWAALRLEVKDYLYRVQVPNNGTGGDLQNQLFTEVGFSVFFPTRNRSIR